MPFRMPHADMTDRILGCYRHVLRFLLPVECEICGRRLGSDPVPFFCRDCWRRIVPFHRPACARCDQPFVSDAATSHTPDHLCHHCQERLPAYRRAWTLFPYVPPLQEAICLFKYRGKVALARSLAELMLAALPEQLDADLVVPVPLHHSRLRSREFNQSLLLADRISRHLNLPVSPTNLTRVAVTEPQTSLSRRDRLKNLRKAFAVRVPHEITDRRILLIDDVYTTGTTVNECAKILIKAGAASVTVLTLARTVDAALVPDRIWVEQAAPPLTALGV